MSEFGELCFIDCAGGRPPPGPQSTILRSHVMREHLRKNPRVRGPRARKKSLSAAASAAAAAAAAAAADATRDASAEPRSVAPHDGRADAHRRDLQIVPYADAAGRGARAAPPDGDRDASSWKTRPHPNDQAYFLLAMQDLSPDVVSLPTPLATPLRIQAQAIFDELYYPPGMSRDLFALDIESIANTESSSRAAKEAGDALCLLLIASVHQDKAMHLQALASYQRALALTNRAIAQTYNLTQSYAAIIATILFLMRHKSIACANFDSSAWLIHHCRAFVALLGANIARGGCPSHLPFRQILVEGFFAAVNIGLATRKWVGLDLPDLFPADTLALYTALSRTPAMLARLDAVTAWQQQPHTEAVPGADPHAHVGVCDDALLLWHEIESEFATWQLLHPDSFATADLDTLPAFAAAVGESLCRELKTAYVFSHSRAAVRHRTVWSALCVLGHSILTALPCCHSQPPASPASFSGSPSSLPSSLSAATTPQAQQLLQHALQEKVNLYAEDLCRTLPFMIEHTAGLGLAVAGSVIHHLMRFYLQQRNAPSTAIAAMKIAYLKKCQGLFLPGMRTQKMLATP